MSFLSFLADIGKGALSSLTGGLLDFGFNSATSQTSPQQMQQQHQNTLAQMAQQNIYNSDLMSQQFGYNRRAQNLAFRQSQSLQDSAISGQMGVNQQLNQFQRDNTRDAALLNMQGIRAAGLNPNILGGSFSNSVASSSGSSSAPSASGSPLGVSGQSVGLGSAAIGTPQSTASILQALSSAKLSEAQAENVKADTSIKQQESETYQSRNQAYLDDVKSTIEFRTAQGENLSWDNEVKRGLSNLQYAEYDKMLAETDKIYADTALSEQEKIESAARTAYYTSQKILGYAQTNRIMQLLPHEIRNMDADSSDKEAHKVLNDDEHARLGLQLAILAKDLDWYEFNKVCEAIGVVGDAAKTIFEGVNTVRGSKSISHSTVKSTSTSKSDVTSVSVNSRSGHELNRNVYDADGKLVGTRTDYFSK